MAYIIFKYKNAFIFIIVLFITIFITVVDFDSSTFELKYPSYTNDPRKRREPEPPPPQKEPILLLPSRNEQQPKRSKQDLMIHDSVPKMVDNSFWTKRFILAALEEIPVKATKKTKKSKKGTTKRTTTKPKKRTAKKPKKRAAKKP